MSKNTKLNNETPLTKEYFDLALDKALDAKFDEKLSNYPTKAEVKIDLMDALNKQNKSFDKKLDEKLSNYATKADLINVQYHLEKKFEDSSQQTRNDIMQFKDDMISMFLDLTTEITSMKSLYNRHDEEIQRLIIR